MLPIGAFDVRWKAPINDPFEVLAAIGVDSPAVYDSRVTLISEWSRQRAAAAGAEGLLLGSVELHPHQLRIVRRVADDPIQRYLLADEVGLGKTIEAGALIWQFLSDHRERAEALREAVARRTDTTGDSFVMTIADERHTKRATAEQALRKELHEAFGALRQHEWRTSYSVPERGLGALGGFDVHLAGQRYDGSRQLVLTTRFTDHETSELWLYPKDLEPGDGDSQVSQPMNLIARLEGTIRRLENQIASTLAEADNLSDEASMLEARINETFPHRERLVELRHRHQEILAELSASAEVEIDDRDEDPSADAAARLDHLKAADGHRQSHGGPGL